MIETVTAVYENGVLVPERELNLPEHAKVEVTIRAAEQQSLARRLSGRIVLDPQVARHIIENEDIYGDD